jgi:hypothetical protein
MTALSMLLSGCAFVERQQLLFGQLLQQVEVTAPLPVTLPFDDSQGHIRVAGVVNGAAPVMVALDTGMPRMVLFRGPHLAPAGLDNTADVKFGSARPSGFRGDVRVGTDLTIGPVEFRDFPAVVAAVRDPVCEARVRQRGMDAIVGRHLFERFTVAFDFDQRQVVLHDPARFAAPVGALEIPIVPRSGGPIARFEMTEADGARRALELLVDTGQVQGLILNSERRDIEVPSEGAEGAYCRLDGKVRYRIGPPVDLAAGSIKLATVAPEFPLERDFGFSGRHGAIGLNAFRGYNLIFDYSRQRMLLVPRTSDPDPAKAAG